MFDRVSRNLFFVKCEYPKGEILGKNFVFRFNRYILDKNKTLMKNSIIFIMILSSLVLKINAQEISESDNSLMDEDLKSRIEIQKEKIVSDTLAKVFNGTFFKINAGFSSTNGGTSFCSDFLFIIKDGILMESDARTDSMYTLLFLLRDDFYLKSEADVKIFETALDKLYPISWSNEEDKEHLKFSNKWYFIRGKFFDSKSGYIVTIDKDSKITNIAYDLKAIEK